MTPLEMRLASDLTFDNAHDLLELKDRTFSTRILCLRLTRECQPLIFDLDLAFITFFCRLALFLLWVHDMTLGNLAENSWFSRVALVSWFVSSSTILVLLSNIDSIVHDKLYDFGLQFSLVWANPYWLAFRFIYLCLVVPSILSAVALGLDLWKQIKSRKRVSVKEHVPVRKSVPEPVSKREVKSQPPKGNSMLISCPSCKKTFGKPLVMLDFSSGKAKLVNNCPYCSKILGDITNDKDEENLEMTVLGPDKKANVKRRRVK